MNRSESTRVSSPSNRSGGLRRRFLRSHLAVAGVGVTALFIIHLGHYWLSSHTWELANAQAPAVHASGDALNGLDRSLSTLRSWLLLGEPELKQTREDAWNDQLLPAMADLEKLSEAWSDPNEKAQLARVSRILGELDEVETRIEEVGHTPENEPAQYLLDQQGEPIADSIFRTITALIDIEKSREAASNRKMLHLSMADIRGHFMRSWGELHEYVNTRREEDYDEYDASFKNALESIRNLEESHDLLNEKQSELLASLKADMDAYESMAKQAIQTRQSEQWNIARHLLVSEALPLVAEADEILATLTHKKTAALEKSASSLGTIISVTTLLSLGLVIAMVVAAYLVSRRNANYLVHPISALVQATQKLARGQLDHDIPIPSNDEVGELTASFNAMRASLERAKCERDDTTRALRESEERFRNAVAGAPFPIMIHAEDGEIILTNNVWIELSGYTREELVTMDDWTQRAYGQPAGSILEHIEQLFAKGKRIHEGERIVCARSGARRIWDFSSAPLGQLPDGRRTVVRMASDITDRKQLELHLQERLELVDFQKNIGIALTSSTLPRPMLQTCSQAMVENLDAAFVRIWTLSPDGKTLELQASAGMYTHLDGDHGRVPVGKFKIGKIAETREPHLSNDVLNDPWVGDPEWARENGMRAFAGHPLMVEDQLIGVVALFSRRTLSSTVIEILATVADSIAIAIRRMQAESELSEERNVLKGVINNIPHFVFWKDRESVYLGCNERFATAAGLQSPDEIVGKTDFDLAWTREEAESYRQCDQEVMGSGEAILNLEEPQHRADGTDIMLLTNKTPLRGQDGEIRGMVGLFIDIAERKAQEERVRLLSAALDEAANAVVVTDADARITWANPSFVAMTGYELDEILGKTPRILKSGKHSREFYQEMWNVLRTGVPWHGELYNRRKNGEIYPEEMTITPVRNEGGEVGHYVAIKQDISERKRNEEERLWFARLEQETEELLHAKQAAESASRAKSEFLANMSHELRTPLNGVITLNELLLKTDLESTQRRYALLAKTSGHTLLALINDILDFSKIEAGMLELEEVDFELHDIVEQVTSAAATLAMQKGLELVCSVHPSIQGYLTGDPTRLRQILTNLVSNALKFTERGEVHLRVESLEENATQSKLRFMVKDTGIGIAEDSRAALFMKFSQADTSTTRKYGGTGLGLAICKQLVDRMGGEIGVDSVLGKGSTFWFEIELPRQANVPQKPASVPAMLRDLRTLVVDDHALNREVVQEQLKSFDVESEAVADGAAALKALRDAIDAKNPFDMAILDFHMPDMNGEELAQAIKSDPELEQTVLLLLSSSIDYDPKRFKKVGFSAWLTKPVRAAELLKAMGEACSITKQKERDASRENRSAVTDSEEQEDAVKNAHILLVEDNEIGQEAARELLRISGYTCDTASNGVLAVQAVLDQYYDLVLMDCQMPEMDGFDATRQIRIHEQAGKIPGPSQRRLPIVALTANALSGDRERCLDSGMDDYLTKPLDPKRLVEMISEQIHCAQEQQEKSDMAEEVEATASPGCAIDFKAITDRWGENPTFANKLLVQFCETVPTLVKQLADEIENQDQEVAARVAHSIKGAAAYVEADCVRSPAEEMEQMFLANEWEGASVHLASLKEGIDRCLEAIQGRVSQKGDVPQST